MKNIYLFIFLLLTTFFSAQSGYGVIAAEEVNFRATPDAKGELLGKIKLGTVAEILEGPVLKGNNMKWCKLKIGSQTGWIAADYVFDLMPLKDIGPAEINFERFIPCVAVSFEQEVMGSRANFLIMIEGDKIAAGVKSYPVKITSSTKEKVESIVFYRDKFLSLELMFGINRILYSDELQDGTTTFAFSTNYIYTSFYVFEMRPKLSEGYFEADIKFYYNKHVED